MKTLELYKYQLLTFLGVFLISTSINAQHGENNQEYVENKTLELTNEPKKLDVFKYYTQQQFQISYDLKEVEMETIESGLLRELERSFLLQQIDYSWKEHLQKISSLREAINWRGYGQKDPLSEFKKEAFVLFEGLLSKIKNDLIKILINITVVNTNEKSTLNEKQNKIEPKYIGKKMGRNEPCYCGSKKKFKHCCGRL